MKFIKPKRTNKNHFKSKVKELKTKICLAEYISDLGYELSERQEGCRCASPLRDGNNPTAFSIFYSEDTTGQETQLFYDFGEPDPNRKCGDLFKFLQLYHGCGFKEALGFAEAYLKREAKNV